MPVYNLIGGSIPYLRYFGGEQRRLTNRLVQVVILSP